jgi:hypothetical protein
MMVIPRCVNEYSTAMAFDFVTRRAIKPADSRLRSVLVSIRCERYPAVGATARADRAFLRAKTKPLVPICRLLSGVTTAWRYRYDAGTKDGSIIATIITTHMRRNDAAAPGQVCPGIRIHAIDIVQRPGIGISPT